MPGKNACRWLSSRRLGSYIPVNLKNGFLERIDTAAIVTVLAGHRIFCNSISALLDKVISADLAICVAVIAAGCSEYLAASEAVFIMSVGEGLEAYAASRTSAAIHRFVKQMPQGARVLHGDPRPGGRAAA